MSPFARKLQQIGSYQNRILTPGTYKPDASTTGTLPGVSLTQYTGDITVTTDGTVLQNLDIFGFITIKAANVTIRNCRVRGSGPGTGGIGLVTCYSSLCVNALIEDCELRPDTPSYWLDGVIGHNYTAKRCNVYWTVDGFGVFDTNQPNGADCGVQILSNFVHDLSLFSPDPNHSDNITHSDGLQIQGGWNGQVIGNNIQGFWQLNNGKGWPGYDPAKSDPLANPPNPNAGNFDYGQSTSCIISTPNVSTVQGWLIDRNWFGGGGISINLPNPNKPSGVSFGTISNNQFDHKQGIPYHSSLSSETTWTIVRDANQPAVCSGNIYEDSGHPVMVR